jgi:hypothetical protein
MTSANGSEACRSDMAFEEGMNQSDLVRVFSAVVFRRANRTIKERTVSLIHKRLSAEVLFALLMALLFLVPGGKAQALSATRSFQMSLWECCTGPAPTPADADIRSVPNAGRYILLGLDWTTPLSADIDWSRVVAVEVDEPYTAVDGSIIGFIGSVPFGLGYTRCFVPPQASAIDALLSQRAAELKARNPRARFWVNLTSQEAGFVEGNSSCYGPLFNKPYIDVISADWYDMDFSNIKPFYDYLAANPAKPDQQLALIPGVFSAPHNQLSYLQGYFDYANSMNQTCNLPRGGRGFTGIYDGCPVWIVMGWLSGDWQGSNTALYKGMFDPASQPIAAAWEAEVALPPGPALRRAKAKVLQPIQQMLLQ